MKHLCFRYGKFSDVDGMDLTVEIGYCLSLGAKKHAPRKKPGSKLPIKSPGQGGKMRHSEVDAAVKVRLSGKGTILCGIEGFSCTFGEISCQSLQTPQTG